MYRSLAQFFPWLLALAFSTPGTLRGAVDEGAVRKTSKKPAMERPDDARDPIQKAAADRLGSVVVISQGGVEGKPEGVGAGFVISKEGLIATSLHVIGEGRTLGIQTAEGTKLEAVEVHAWDRRFDLAILRVKGRLPAPIPLGDSDLLKPGDEVIAIGNPMGLEHSVVRGVASATREIEGVEMIQVAIPIEPGNSGGPLLDRQGAVVGIMALKSAMTANLGFAVPVSALKRLMDRPNPVLMDRWLNMEALDGASWETRFGASWKQKVDRIVVEETGNGFGGRSLCLSKTPPPALPFEIAVSVKLDDESGAAGIVFGSDGGDRHYGFYATGGQLRLTRFDGPNVFSWKILEQAQTDRYRRGQWNRIKVRVEVDTILCFVNGEQIFKSSDSQRTGGQVGLCKFRNTRAEFKQFAVGSALEEAPQSLSQEVLNQLTDYVKKPSRELENSLTTNMASRQPATLRALEDRAAQLERDAVVLRKLARQSRAHRVEDDLRQLLTASEKEIDLIQAALLVAQLDDPDLDVESYRSHFQRLVHDLKQKLPPNADERGKFRTLKDFFFRDQGFHGSRHEYYEKANSYLNRVMEQREGIPISLSILFMELGRHVGLQGLRGHPFPGHFMLANRASGGTEQVIDVFEGGRELTHSEVDLAFGQRGETSLRSESIEPAKKRDIILRMVRNLQGISSGEGSHSDSLRYLDLILVLQPSSAVDRLDRARLRSQTGDIAGAREDIKWLADHSPPGVDPERVDELLKALDQ